MIILKPLSTRYTVMILIIITIGIYYESLFELFSKATVVSIDDHRILEGLTNHKLSWQEVFIPGNAGKYYRPLIDLTYFVDQRLWGDISSGYRLTNILIHASNVVLLYLSARLLLKHEHNNNIIAFCSALLFVVHPITVESVAWISGRTDLMAVFWSLLSIFCYLHWKQKNRLWILCVSQLFSMSAILSKEVAIITPIIIMLWELYFNMSFNYNRSKHIGLLTVLFISVISGYLVIRYIALMGGDISSYMISRSIFGYELLSSLKLFLASYGFYLKKFIWPLPLNIAINSINITLYAIFGALVLPFLIFQFIINEKKIYSFLFIWAMLGIGPPALVSFTYIAWTLWAERYLYFSLVPFSILSIMSALKLSEQLNDYGRRAIYIAGFCILVVFAVMSFYRSFIWNDNVRLWKDAYNKSPQFIYAATGYAGALIEKGKISEAEKVLHEAATLPGPKHTVYLQLGHLSLKKGDERKAKKYYSDALDEARHDKKLILMGPYLRKKILMSIADIELENASRAGNQRIRNYYYHEAIMKLQEAYYEDSSDNFLLYIIAKLYAASGDNNSAAQYLKKFTKKWRNDGYRETANRMISRIEGM